MEKTMEGLVWLCVLWLMLSVQKVKYFTSNFTYEHTRAHAHTYTLMYNCNIWRIIYNAYKCIPFSGNLDEAICLYKKGLQVIKDTNYVDLDDDILENLRIDLAELLHLSGR